MVLDLMVEVFINYKMVSYTNMTAQGGSQVGEVPFLVSQVG